MHNSRWCELARGKDICYGNFHFFQTSKIVSYEFLTHSYIRKKTANCPLEVKNSTQSKDQTQSKDLINTRFTENFRAVQLIVLDYDFVHRKIFVCEIMMINMSEQHYSF